MTRPVDAERVIAALQQQTAKMALRFALPPAQQQTEPASTTDA